MTATLGKEDFPDAAVRVGVGELTRRRGEEGMPCTFMITTLAGDSGWRPPLVDEDWQAVCQRRGRVMGEVVLHVRGHEQGSQRPTPSWSSRAKPCAKQETLFGEGRRI